jgi:hypothetical protein
MSPEAKQSPLMPILLTGAVSLIFGFAIAVVRFKLPVLRKGGG